MRYSGKVLLKVTCLFALLLVWVFCCAVAVASSLSSSGQRGGEQSGGTVQWYLEGCFELKIEHRGLQILGLLQGEFGLFFQRKPRQIGVLNARGVYPKLGCYASIIELL